MTDMNSQMVEVLKGIHSEITVDIEGKGSITKNGLCVLLGISRSSLSVRQMSQKLAESLTQLGFSNVGNDFDGGIPDIAAQCIIEYYAFDAKQTSDNAKTIFRTFAAIGIRTWFQDVTGYQKSAPISQPEQFRLAAKALLDMAVIMEDTENKPGLKNIIDSALERDGKALPGLITVAEVMMRKGREYSHKDKSAIGMYVSTAYRNLTGKAPEMVKVKHPAKDGKKGQTVLTPHYPLDFIPVIENAIELGFGS